MNMLTPQMLGYDGSGLGNTMSLSNMLEGSNNHPNGGCGITDSIRANMGLPPPPATPPSQGPFGPAGLVTAKDGNSSGGFKRPLYPNFSNHPTMPVNNNSFGLATPGKKKNMERHFCMKNIFLLQATPFILTLVMTIPPNWRSR